MQLIANNAFSKVGASIGAGDLTLTVTSGQGDNFPPVSSPDFCVLTLQDAAGHIEIVKVTARAPGADAMTIVRAQEGTAARSWVIGDLVGLRATAGLLAPLRIFAGASTDADMRSSMSAPKADGSGASGTWGIDISASLTDAAASDTLPTAGPSTALALLQTVRDFQKWAKARLAQATSGAVGVLKLFTGTGSATDGAMTQKAVTDELNKKVDGAASSADGHVMLFDGATGKKTKSAGVALGTAGSAALTTSTTDTTPGRVLKVGDFGLGVPISIGSANNLNDFTAPGFFTWTSSVPTNAPSGSANCDMLVNGLSQYVFLRDASEVVWYRVWSGGSWQGWVSLHHTGNIKRALGSDDNYPISQKAVTDAFGQPSTTASATFSAAYGNVGMTGVTAALGLEVGDVIEITGSASNNGLRTVDAISGDTLFLNIAHSTYGGLLAVVNETVSCTIKRIAKWYHASPGLGRAWLTMTAGRAFTTTYTPPGGRDMMVSIHASGGTGGTGGVRMSFLGGGFVDQVATNSGGGIYSNWVGLVNRGYQANGYIGGESVTNWFELR